MRFLFLFENNPKNLDWSYKMDLHFKKNLKILDPSYEMDLDIQDYFGRKNMQCFCQRMLYMRCKKVVQYLDSKDSDQLAEYAVFYMDLSGFPIFFFLLCLAFFNAAGQHSFESTTSQYFGWCFATFDGINLIWMDWWMDWWMDDLEFYVLFNSISDISGWWEGDTEKLWAMEPYLCLKRFYSSGNRTGQRLTY